jgi:hypothetical protein
MDLKPATIFLFYWIAVQNSNSEPVLIFFCRFFKT